MDFEERRLESCGEQRTPVRLVAHSLLLGFARRLPKPPRQPQANSDNHYAQNHYPMALEDAAEQSHDLRAEPEHQHRQHEKSDKSSQENSPQEIAEAHLE